MKKEINNFFNIKNFSQGIKRELAKGVNARIFPGVEAMISVVNLQPNASGKIHNHPQEQWGIMISGSGIRIQNNDKIPVVEGDFWRTPGGIDHGFVAGKDGAIIVDVFAPPREEYKKEGTGFK